MSRDEDEHALTFGTPVRMRPAELDDVQLQQALAVVQRTGDAVVAPDGATAALAAPRSAVPPPATPKEYAVITARSGRVWASGAGLSAHSDQAGDDGVAILLNAAAAEGYRVVSNVAVGPVAMWTLERDRRGQETLRSTPAGSRR